MRRKQPDIDRLFHALGDPRRRAIVDLLSHELVKTEKAGRVRTCRLEPSGLSAAESWIRDRRTMWDRARDRLGDFLAEEEN